MENYDIAIIGTGPAGLEAAITAKIRNKKILLLGKKELSDKITKPSKIENYLGLPNVTGQELFNHFTNHLKELEIEITEDIINAIYKQPNNFILQGSNNSYSATSVIIATGISVIKEYNNEQEFLGRGVSYCATCDGNFYKGLDVAVISFSSNEESDANYLSEIVNKVYYIPMYKDINKLNDNIEIVNDKVQDIKGNLKVEELVLEHKTLKVDGIFILRNTFSPSQLIKNIKMDKTSIEVNKNMETSIKGVFACGDITGAPFQYIKSAGEGNIAALSAVKYLDTK